MRIDTETASRYAVDCERAGLTYSDAETLRRAALTLHGIAEQECNGTLLRVEEPQTDHRGRPMIVGAVYQVGNINGPGPLYYYRTADRESGARRRIEAVAARVGARVEYQGDPRGWPVKLIMADSRELSIPPYSR